MLARIYWKGLLTGLFLQLAIGPVFFFVMNLTLQRTVYDGLAAVVGVTLADYVYIILSALGIGRLMENARIKRYFGIASSIVLVIFGCFIMAGSRTVSANAGIHSTTLLSSFFSALALTLSNPITIVLITGIFAATVIENNYKKHELYVFSIAVGSATLLFMGTSVLIFSFIKGTIPLAMFRYLNALVGVGLICYGILRARKVSKIL